MSADRPAERPGPRRGLAGRVLGDRYRVDADGLGRRQHADRRRRGHSSSTGRSPSSWCARSGPSRRSSARRFAPTMRAMSSSCRTPTSPPSTTGARRRSASARPSTPSSSTSSGGSLRDLFDRGRYLDPSQALVVGLEACRGLDFAHRKGLVHTELTPSKLVFGDDRRLRIVDFGLARLLGDRRLDASRRPSPTHVARYSSPEQALGQPIDGKTDVYSLALILVEAVTGTVPFAARSTVATLSARVGRLMPVSADLGPLAVGARAGRPARPGRPLDGRRARPRPRAGRREAAPPDADPARSSPARSTTTRAGCAGPTTRPAGIARPAEPTAAPVVPSCRRPRRRRAPDGRPAAADRRDAARRPTRRGCVADAGRRAPVPDAAGGDAAVPPPAGAGAATAAARTTATPTARSTSWPTLGPAPAARPTRAAPSAGRRHRRARRAGRRPPSRRSPPAAPAPVAAVARRPRSCVAALAGLGLPRLRAVPGARRTRSPSSSASTRRRRRAADRRLRLGHRRRSSERSDEQPDAGRRSSAPRRRPASELAEGEPFLVVVSEGPEFRDAPRPRRPDR